MFGRQILRLDRIEKMENELIKIAKKYLQDKTPKSEILLNELVDIAKTITPTTPGGVAIAAWVKAEIETGFTLGANDEFVTMVEIIGE